MLSNSAGWACVLMKIDWPNCIIITVHVDFLSQSNGDFTNADYKDGYGAQCPELLLSPSVLSLKYARAFAPLWSKREHSWRFQAAL